MVWFYLCESRFIAEYKHVLSIPLWSDFISPLNSSTISPAWDFQSHYGLILSKESKKSGMLKSNLSIPLWSDFIIVINDANCNNNYIFQSHYGLILSN